MKIFEVLSNLNHNGTVYQAGQFIEGELKEFAQAIEGNVVKLVKGAKTTDEAIVAKAEASVGTSEQKAEPEAPQTASEAPKEASPESRFTVLKEFEITNESSSNFGKHTVGEVIKADPVAAQPFVDDGTLELFVGIQDEKLPDAGDNL